MLLNRKNTLKNTLNEKIIIFQCPICYESLLIENDSLKCIKKHNYNISSKGNFALCKTSKIKKNIIYDKNLFMNRKKFIETGVYEFLHNKISDLINKHFSNCLCDELTILDMGCGECTHDSLIIKKLEKPATLFGIDLAKDGIDLASMYVSQKIVPILADLNNLPFKENSFDIILNILSPSNEIEMSRVLNNNGIIFKVTPKKEYLIELRKNFKINEYLNEEKIEKNILKNYDVLEKIDVSYIYEINNENIENLIEMTPLTNHINIEHASNIKSVTIALNIFVLKPKLRKGEIV